ncbi:MAG TPA: NAD(P)-binding domain-containing protein [Candidatus Acidoferrum sp.]|nr:NAD(P)-binding domain-containing protein [Candidatus Acidoferrum sp.]
MSLPARTDTVVVGAGQAGLAMSRYLSVGGWDHVVLERRATLGGGWQDRWDEFCLVSPNWIASFPGDPYDGDDGDGFMLRDEIAARVAGYAAKVKAPVSLETTVERVTTTSEGFTVRTSQGEIAARNVVVAIGGFHKPKIPGAAASLSPRLLSIHSHDYRNAAALPAGGVLVVGSAQSGVQIAEELAEAGREVYLSVGTAGRLPRRYRGRDCFRWLVGLATYGPQLGIALPSVDRLPDPRIRVAGNAHLSGHNGGHDTNLRKMALDGMTLVGRLQSIDGETIQFAPDLSTNLAKADALFDERFRPQMDRLIEHLGIDAPPDDRVSYDFEPPEVSVLNLLDRGISTVLWTTGYERDYSWIEPSTVDDMGFPRQTRGVSELPGLYFLGALWQHTMVSATLGGPGIDGRDVAISMGLTIPEEPPLFAI